MLDPAISSTLSDTGGRWGFCAHIQSRIPEMIIPWVFQGV